MKTTSCKVHGIGREAQVLGPNVLFKTLRWPHKNDDEIGAVGIVGVSAMC